MDNEEKKRKRINTHKVAVFLVVHKNNRGKKKKKDKKECPYEGFPMYGERRRIHQTYFISRFPDAEALEEAEVNVLDIIMLSKVHLYIF